MMNEKAFSFIIYCINSGCCSFVFHNAYTQYSKLFLLCQPSIRHDYIS